MNDAKETKGEGRLTPMLRQYLDIKEKYPDAFLFYRMGDFYEMFFEDAAEAAPILEIALTARNKNEGVPVPMCGVPVRSVKGYIKKLIEKGKRVAVCEQVEDPKDAKGLVAREVVRVISPGMILEGDLLADNANNFILAAGMHGSEFGLAYMDITTGAVFRVCASDDMQAVVDEVLRVCPSEYLVPGPGKDHFPFVDETKENNGSNDMDPGYAALCQMIQEKAGEGRIALTRTDPAYFDFQKAYERLTSHFKTLNLEGLGLEKKPACICAAGALLSYIDEMIRDNPLEAWGGASVEVYSLDTFLLVDDVSARNLELLSNIWNQGREGTLISVLDKTRTPMGGRRMRGWVRYPLMHISRIRKRHDAVEKALTASVERKAINRCLKSISDIERLGSRVAMGTACPKDLLALSASVSYFPDIISHLNGFNMKWFLEDSDADIHHLEETASFIAKRIRETIREDAPMVLSDGGVIREGYDAELDSLIELSTRGKARLAEMEARERKETGIPGLKIGYNRVFGYYIEISRARAGEAPDHYIRKQTLVNAERYITQELKEFETQVETAQERRIQKEQEIFHALRKEVAAHNSSIQEIARFISRADCIFALADVAEANRYCRPVMNTRGVIHIKDGRHPVLEKGIRGERFVPNTISMDSGENRVLIITGPNMSGKSTVLRQTALTVLMAQMGSFVPAKEADIAVTDKIFTRVGALDNLSQGQSTFMVEMQETAAILHNSTGKSLVIMDEIGRGTSTYDGLSIAWAVAEYLHDLKGKGVKTMFATHYHELTRLAESKEGVKNYCIAVKEYEGEVIFLRKLIKGSTNKSLGIQVARLAGMPRKTINRAGEILKDIEKHAPSAILPRQLTKTTNLRQVGIFPAHHSDPEEDRNALSEKQEKIIDELKNIEISTLTPLESMNKLDALIRMANEDHHREPGNRQVD